MAGGIPVYTGHALDLHLLIQQGGAATQPGVILSGRFPSEQGPFWGYHAYCIQYVMCIVYLVYIHTCIQVHISSVYCGLALARGPGMPRSSWQIMRRFVEQEQISADVLLCPM